MKIREYNNYLTTLFFALLHAFCCITCGLLNVPDSFVLTLLTITMVFILCYSHQIKYLFIVISAIIFVIAAYIFGNAIPKLLHPILGDTFWNNAVSTFLTTLCLGCAFEFFVGRFVHRSFRDRWIVHFNNRIVPVNTEQISYFYSEDKCNYLVTRDGTRYIIDSTIDSIVPELDPEKFFRINRGCVLSQGAIDAVVKDSGRYVVDVNPASPSPLIITRSRVDEFMKWLA